MPRSEARIRTLTWRNTDFTDLTRAQQGTYWMVLSQPDMSQAGVVPHVPARWAALSADDRSDLDADIAELHDRRYLLVDEATGEVWVRTFAKHDGILRSYKTRIGMWTAYQAILSLHIRRAFIDELDQEHIDEALSEGWITQDDLPDPEQEPLSDTPSNNHHTPSDTPSDTGSPRARAASAPAPTSAPASKSDDDEGFDDFWQRYPRGQAGKPGGDGNRKKALHRWQRMTREQRWLALQAVDHYREFIDRDDSPFAAHATTWLNQERWNEWQEPAAPTANGRPPPGREHEALDRYDPAVWTAR